MTKQQTANHAIDAITNAMALVASLELLDDSLTAAAHLHLTDARKLLVARYQPNTEEMGR